MRDISELFSNKINEFFPNCDFPKKVAVAVSGGSDSLSLTFLLKEFCEKNNVELFALTVDHKMRQDSSQEALELAKILQKEKISHQILSINSNEIPQTNIEAKLRKMRYELMHEFCLKNDIKFLFLGHIQGDIAENFIIRLFRGSGLDGLSTIAEISDFKEVTLMRPLLDISKDELKAYLQQKNIKWFEDETNEDEKFLRNKIRKFFDSFEDKNLIQKRIKNTCDDISKMRDLFDHEMLEEALEILEFRDNSFIVFDIFKLSKLEERIALKILALSLMEIGQKPYKPRLEKLKRFYDWIVENEDHRPRNFYGCITKSFSENKLAIYNEENPHKKIKKLNTILGKVFNENSK